MKFQRAYYVMMSFGLALWPIGNGAIAQNVGMHTDNLEEVAPQPKAKAAKITDKRHPDNVRCRTESVIGSLAKKRRVCLTNHQWSEVERKGNGLARDMVAENQSKPGSN